MMFDKTTQIAKCYDNTQFCYSEVVETQNQSLKAKSYLPTEPWKQLGLNIKSMNVESTMSWPTLQSNLKLKTKIATWPTML
jgi:hypothetical protein